MKRAIVALLLATACAMPKASETKQDSTTLSGDPLEMASDEVKPKDTLYNPLSIADKFKEPQIDPNLGYVYAGRLDVFDTNVASNVIGHIDFKTKVKLLDGMRGEYTAIEFEGKTGYVDSNFILNLPVPETKDVVEYFTGNLMLTKDPIERKNTGDLNDTDGMFSFIDYSFERGFKIQSKIQYESGFKEVTLPGMSMRKAFLFDSFFYDSFGEVFGEFPTAARDEELAEQRHVTVTLENGEVIDITIGNGEGCYWEDSLTADSNGCRMHTSGGC